MGPGEPIESMNFRTLKLLHKPDQHECLIAVYCDPVRLLVNRRYLAAASGGEQRGET